MNAVYTMRLSRSPVITHYGRGQPATRCTHKFRLKIESSQRASERESWLGWSVRQWVCASRLSSCLIKAHCRWCCYCVNQCWSINQSHWHTVV